MANPSDPVKRLGNIIALLAPYMSRQQHRGLLAVPVDLQSPQTLVVSQNLHPPTGERRCGFPVARSSDKDEQPQSPSTMEALPPWAISK